MFKDGLMFNACAYRTPYLNPALSHNQLILKKGLPLLRNPLQIWVLLLYVAGMGEMSNQVLKDLIMFSELSTCPNPILGRSTKFKSV